MKLLNKKIIEELRKNSTTNSYRAAKGQEGKDFKPLVKIFNPTGKLRSPDRVGGMATWLFTEIDEQNILFGLCDLGFGYPELGCVSLDDLESIPYLKRDIWFRAEKTLKQYAHEAKMNGVIAA
jgi:hypothetical protein